MTERERQIERHAIEEQFRDPATRALEASIKFMESDCTECDGSNEDHEKVDCRNRTGHAFCAPSCRRCGGTSEERCPNDI